MQTAKSIFTAILALLASSTSVSYAQEVPSPSSQPVAAQASPLAILDNVPEPSSAFIAVIGPVKSSTTSQVGLSCLRGAYQEYIEHVDLWKVFGVKFVFLDDHSSPERAREYALKLTQNPNCLAIVGSSDSGSTEAIDDVIAHSSHPLPLISPVSSATTIGQNNPWVFRVNLTDYKMADTVLRYLHFRTGKPMRLVSVYADNYYGQHVNADLQAVCESYEPGTCQFLAGVSYPNQIMIDTEKVASSVARLKPDVIGLFGQTQQCGPLAKAIRARYQDGILFGTTANATPQFVEYAGSAAEGVLIVTSYSSAGSSTLNSLGWKDRFRALYSVDPDNFAAQGFDAIQVLRKAIVATNIKTFAFKPQFDAEVDGQRVGIRGQLLQTNVQGILGPITFGPDRVIQIEPGLVIWNNSSLVPPALYKAPTKETWFHSRNSQTVIVFGCILAVFLIVARVSHAIAGRWLPPIVASVCATGLQVDKVQSLFGLDLNGPLLVGLISIAFIGGCGALVISPSWFRALIVAEPFSLIGLLALRNGRFRRNYFDRYISLSVRELREDAKAANDETYIPIPAYFSIASDRAEDLSAARLEWEPARSLGAVLCSCKTALCNIPVALIVDSSSGGDVVKRCHVAVEAPGGQGKSALLRAVLSELYSRYQQGDNHPLPILLRGSGKDFAELVSRSLGSETLPDVFLRVLLESGAVVLVFDGLSEVDLDPEILRNFVRSTAGEVTGTIVTFRPDEKLRAAACSSQRWLHCEPSRLDESTIGGFVHAYSDLDHQAPRDRSLDPLMQTIRTACRAEDGTFLPILVRLALLVNRTDISGVADLYRETVRMLLDHPMTRGDEHNLVRAAGSLCIDTFWRRGMRLMAYADCDTETKVVMKQLLSAGLLVQVDSATVRISGAEPRAVKFFHDSVQSYLTARALANQGGLEYLRRAAGDKLFLEARDRTRGTWRSELFEMCEEIMVDRRQLADFLASDLKSWARAYDGELVKNRVIEVLPESFRVEIQHQVVEAAGAGAWLSVAVESCQQRYVTLEGRELALKTLVGLYETVAPIVWPRIGDQAINTSDGSANRDKSAHQDVAPII
jgi:ABC-type branched-subunit amino acid transport system substrate-binding protein